MAGQKQTYNLPKAQDSAEKVRLIGEARRMLEEAIVEHLPYKFEICRMMLWQADADEGTLSLSLKSFGLGTLNDAGIRSRLERARDLLDKALRECKADLIRYCHENIGLAIQLGATDAQISRVLRDLMGDKETLDQIKHELSLAQIRPIAEGDLS